MKERPILFSAPMVRAILDGTKTQTRRVVKPQPVATFRRMSGAVAQFWDGDSITGLDCERRCPYGQPGDRLWVRETWQAVNGNDRARHIMTHPRPDRGWLEYAATPRADEPAYKWRPSIHMPRWASRITLEVTGVRVERLQDISEADALSEGIRKQWTTGWFSAPGIKGSGTTARAAYALLWNSINGPCSWDANPWVWVVEFKRVEGGAA